MKDSGQVSQVFVKSLILAMIVCGAANTLGIN